MGSDAGSAATSCTRRRGQIVRAVAVAECDRSDSAPAAVAQCADSGAVVDRRRVEVAVCVGEVDCPESGADFAELGDGDDVQQGDKAGVLGVRWRCCAVEVCARNGGEGGGGGVDGGVAGRRGRVE